MDPVALREDVRAHLGVPAAGLVTEVDSGFQQLPHRDGGHACPPVVWSSADPRRGPGGSPPPAPSRSRCGPRGLRPALGEHGRDVPAAAAPQRAECSTQPPSAYALRPGVSAARTPRIRRPQRPTPRWWRTRGPARPSEDGSTATTSNRIGRRGSDVPSSRASSVRSAAQARRSATLAVVEGLLGQAIVAPTARTNLQDHERRRRAGIDGDDVELVATEPEPASQDPPARFGQRAGDGSLGSITGASRLGGHRRRMEPVALQRLIGQRCPERRPAEVRVPSRDRRAGPIEGREER